MAKVWLSLAEAAEYLGVEQKTLRRMIDRGELSANRFGPRLIRIAQADLDAAMQPIAATYSAK